ncbi:hypothetical protein ACFX2C_002384 [Malus domestica]
MQAVVRNPPSLFPWEAVEICVLLRPNMLKDMDVCAKFVDGIKRVVGPSSFAKHTTEYRMIALRFQGSRP